MTRTEKPAAAPTEPSPAAALLAELESTYAGPPNLGDVLSPSDVSTKGTGTYAADYVNWARVAHLLHQHAPGWQFHLTTAPDGGHVWSAPNGTAYVVGFFMGLDGQRTPDFPQAVMDNRNAPKALASVSARDVTDTHRRCLCAAAAAAFGLAWQLWAKEPLEDPHADRPALQSDRPVPQAPQAQPASPLDQARKRAMEAGLTAAGAQAAAMELTSGASSSFAAIPEHLLQRIAAAGLTPDTVARWNAGQQPAAAPAPVAATAAA